MIAIRLCVTGIDLEIPNKGSNLLIFELFAPTLPGRDPFAEWSDSDSTTGETGTGHAPGFTCFFA